MIIFTRRPFYFPITSSSNDALLLVQFFWWCVTFRHTAGLACIGCPCVPRIRSLLLTCACMGSSLDNPPVAMHSSAVTKQKSCAVPAHSYGPLSPPVRAHQQPHLHRTARGQSDFLPPYQLRPPSLHGFPLTSEDQIPSSSFKYSPPVTISFTLLNTLIYLVERLDSP
jgi:hypothetical protein